MVTHHDTYDLLMAQIKILSEEIWKDKWEKGLQDKWINNFQEEEKLHALYLLSKFMYFGNDLIREMLKCIFRDIYRYPIIENYRRNNNHTLDPIAIEKHFNACLSQTRFLGLGNPSESGVHLLYLFRQENNLPKDLFINSGDIFSIHLVEKKDAVGNITERYHVSKLSRDDVKHYIFIDDFCLSGSQAVTYSQKHVKWIKDSDPTIKVDYYSLFSTAEGLKRVKAESSFDKVIAVYEIDETFKCFSDHSRYFSNERRNREHGYDKNICRTMCEGYGRRLCPEAPLGFSDGQLMIGFQYNTPDNSLPIFWKETSYWKAVFKRYDKLY